MTRVVRKSRRAAGQASEQDQRLLALMQDALLRLGVRLRVEELPEEAHVRGGVCRYAGEQVLFVSPAASAAERREQMLAALAGLDADGLWLPPLVRAWLDRHREAHAEQEARHRG